MPMTTRRRFILGSLGATSALVLGWSALPVRQRLSTARPLPVSGSEAALNGWVKIDADSTVTVMLAKSEMGQGVSTSLAMVLADELDADWAKLRTETSPIDKIYNNLATVVDGLPFHPDSTSTLKRVAGWLTAKSMREIGVMMTGGSSSLKDLWLPMREAGASARAMLVAAAAAEWGVPAAEVRVKAGVLSHASGKTAPMGHFAAAAAALPLPAAVTLKTPAQFTLIGHAQSRKDNAAKLDGSARFGIDALPPGLLYASVVMCPELGGGLAGFDAAQALAMPGVKKVIALGTAAGLTAGVAAIAEQPWQAMQAVKAVLPQWSPGPAAAWSSADVFKRLRDELDHEDGFAYYSEGDAAAALKGAARTLKAEYQAPYLAHAAMEPINCTVLLKDGAGTVWASTQVPGIARSAAAHALGIDAERVSVNVGFLGGGFGRRLDVDFIAQAAEIARAMEGRPVQTIWSREQDFTHDFYRPACVSRFEAGLDAQGRLTAWHNVSAGQAIVPKAVSRAFGLPMAGPDKTTSEGAFDQPYEWPAARIAHRIVDLPIPIGFWRSVGHSHQAFFKESFVDEVAQATGQDPLAFRLALLKNHPRHQAVLRRAADKAGWGTPVAPAPDGAKVARGLALHQSFGSIVAEVAEVSVGPDRTIRVHRVVCAVDCGTVVNPDGVRQQLESAVIFGLSAALHGEITLDKGRVQQSNFHQQGAVRMADCPRIEVEILPSAEPPEGLGEPGLPPLAPAVANALARLTGQRLRALPLRMPAA